MKPTTPHFALQLDPKDRGLDADGGEILASKQADVLLADGGSRRVTVFFRVSPEKLGELRALKQAESAKSTAQSFKRFLLEQGLPPEKVELAMVKITEHSALVSAQGRHIRRQSESSLRRQQIGQTAPPARRVSLGKLRQVLGGARGRERRTSDASGPHIPAGLFSLLLTRAIERGSLLRVDPALKQTTAGTGEARRANASASAGRPAARSTGPMRYKPLPPAPDRPAPRAGQGKPLPATPVARAVQPRIPKEGMPPLPTLPPLPGDK